jgi:hypothetical protein
VAVRPSGAYHHRVLLRANEGAQSLACSPKVTLEFIAMSTIRTLSAAVFAALIALSTASQAQQATDAPASAAAKPMAKHDHAATKGMPSAHAKAANPADAASAPEAGASKAKKKINHDHTKSHKLM